MSNTSHSVTYTLRLPEKLKGRLEATATNRGLSLNQLILEIIDQKYLAAGFSDRMTVQTRGRSLVVRVRELKNHPPGMPMCHFFLDDPTRGMEVACYTFGFSEQFMRQLHIKEGQQYESIADLGLALLHHFNKTGLDITRLEWCQFPTISDRRIFQVQDGKTRGTQVFITSIEQFIAALHEELWLDRYLSVHAKRNLDARTLNELRQVAPQDKEILLDNIVEFEPTKRFAKIEEAIEEAVSKAKEKRCAFRFDCNDFVMIIDANSDINTLINKYWEFKHNEGIASGSAKNFPITAKSTNQ
jgi:hypothetical protein